MLIKKILSSFSIFVIFFKINLKKIIPTLNKFKGLRFRNEIVINTKKIKVINDSHKSTSFSSSRAYRHQEENFLDFRRITKKRGQIYISKKDCYNLRAYIFGKNANFL